MYPLRALLLALLPALLLGAAPAHAQAAPAQDPSSAQPTDPQPPDDDAAALEADGAVDEAAIAGSGAAAPAAFTGLRGQVVDAETKEPLIEATVKVVSGADLQVLTDLDGRYVLPLPPGKYDLRVFYDVYQGRRITGVEVREGKATQLDVALSGDAAAVQEVVVEARVDKRAEGALLQERKKAAAVSDVISAQEISRTPDSNASDAVKRVVSATVVDGRFMLLRGLGGRYSVALLNGALLPSPEPDEPAIPLDIFPTSLLANLNVVKSYTPDLPGTFGGGALLIETNSYPTEFEFKPRLTLSGDSQTTFRSRNSHGGGFVENLGFAGSTRRLPSAVPTDGPLRDTRAESARVGPTFLNSWSAGRSSALPNGALGFSLGDTVRFGSKRLGYLASANYGRKETRLLSTSAELAESADGYTTTDPAASELGSQSATLNGLLNAQYQLSRDHELTVFSLYTRTAENRTQTTGGFSDNDNRNYAGTRLQFVSRALSFNQVRGFHRTGLLNDSEIDWQANFSHVDRSEPDTRDITYYANTDGTRTYRDQPGSGDRFFAELAESSTGGTLNLTVPLSALRLEVGGLAQLSFRDFSARRFRFDCISCSNEDVGKAPEQLFAGSNLGPSVLVLEDTRNEDAYDATLNVFAGYVNADLKATEALRLVGGVRYETSQQTLEADSPFSITSDQAKRTDHSYADVLPAANVVYALSPTVNLRAGYSYTLARPTFRELAPYLFYDFVRRRAVSGNENLVETRIHNGDLRAEWFVGENEVLAASAFAKRFQDPIERVIENVSGGDISYRNAEAGSVYGLELEARTSLRRLTPALANFRAAGNLTLIRSEVDLGEGSGSNTHRERPLQGQSPYVVNLNLGYERPESGTEIALLYNVYGRRISEAGVFTLPDVYEQPFHRVDLAVSQRLSGGMQLKLTGSNLLDSQVTLEQAGTTLLSYRPGIAFSAQLGFSL